jgi:hypothetical protein
MDNAASHIDYPVGRQRSQDGRLDSQRSGSSNQGDQGQPAGIAEANEVVRSKPCGLLHDRGRRVPGATANRRPGLRGGRVRDHDASDWVRRLRVSMKKINAARRIKSSPNAKIQGQGDAPASAAAMPFEWMVCDL